VFSLGSRHIRGSYSRRIERGVGMRAAIFGGPHNITVGERPVSNGLWLSIEPSVVGCELSGFCCSHSTPSCRPRHCSSTGDRAINRPSWVRDVPPFTRAR
jgi:hypothetical protein